MIKYPEEKLIESINNIMGKYIKNTSPYEKWEQQKVFFWRDQNIDKHPELKFMSGSINGVKLHNALKIKMKKQGMIKGVPDIDFPFKNKNYSGLHIELKRIKGGKTTPEQKEYLQFLANQGRKAVICKGHKAAIKVIEEYLKDI